MKPTDKALTDLGFTFKSFWGWCWTNKHYMIMQAHKTWALWNAGGSYIIKRFSRLKDLLAYLEAHKDGE